MMIVTDGGGCDDDSDRCILATGSILLFPLPRSIIDPGRFWLAMRQHRRNNQCRANEIIATTSNKLRDVGGYNDTILYSPPAPIEEYTRLLLMRKGINEETIGASNVCKQTSLNLAAREEKSKNVKINVSLIMRNTGLCGGYFKIILHVWNKGTQISRVFLITLDQGHI